MWRLASPHTPCVPLPTFHRVGSLLSRGGRARRFGRAGLAPAYCYTLVSPTPDALATHALPPVYLAREGETLQASTSC